MDAEAIRRVVKVADFAAVKHKNQRRKDPEGTPYINHPLGVARILTEEGDVADIDVIEAAILHDTVEDTETTFEELEELFGVRVTGIVREVTDDKLSPKEERKAQQVSTAGKKSTEAKLVKMADKIYNLRDLERTLPKGWTEQRRAEYFVWAQKVVVQCYQVNSKLAAILQDIFQRNIPAGTK